MARGRVFYDRTALCFVVRTDSQLHLPAFVHFIASHFRIKVTVATVLSDDHYHSVRSVPMPRRE